MTAVSEECGYGTASPGQAAEGTLSSGSEPVHEKVRIEGERLVDALPLHHGERHAVDEAE